MAKDAKVHAQDANFAVTHRGVIFWQITNTLVLYVKCATPLLRGTLHAGFYGGGGGGGDEEGGGGGGMRRSERRGLRVRGRMGRGFEAFGDSTHSSSTWSWSGIGLGPGLGLVFF